MSYGVMAYLVDTNEILDLLKDPQLKKRGFLSSIFSDRSRSKEIKKLFEFGKGEFDDLDEGIIETMEEDEGEEEYTLSRDVMKEFLNNDFKDSNYGQYYGYVFKIICEYSGRSLDNSEWYPCSVDNYFSIPFTSKLPVKFPNPHGEPNIDYIKHTDIDLGNANYENMDEDQKERLIDWFKQAINLKKDIYLFYH